MINTSSNIGQHRKNTNNLETLINTANTNLTNLNTTLTNRISTVEKETQPIARGGTGATTAATARKNLGITRETNGYSYNQLGALYLGSSNTNSYIRITLPTTASTWMMCMMEISLRLYASGPKFGKLLVHGYWSSSADWNNFYAHTTGFLKSDISVYGSDKKYIYIKIPSTTYFTCSLDKMNIGDNAVGYDYSYITIDTVASLPSTYQTANLYSSVSLKETYKSGDSWYRVYSDGWIEQGGAFSCSTGITATATQVTFIKAFTSSVNIIGGFVKSKNSAAYGQLYFQNGNTTLTGMVCSVICYNSGGSVQHSISGGTGYWYACGY